MSDPKLKGKRLAEFAETDAILRLLTGVQKPKAGKKTKQQVDEEINPPPLPEPALTPPVEAFVGDDAGRPAELDSPAIPKAKTETASEAVEIIEKLPPIPQQSVVASPAAQVEPDRLSTALPMHAVVESYAAPALTDFEAAFQEREPCKKDGERNAANRIGETAQSDSVFRTPSSVLPAEPVPRPIGALSFGDLLTRINWKNRPEDVQPLPLIGEPDPPGYAESVEGVLAAFKWDDE
jgi:hypothetical protein